MRSLNLDHLQALVAVVETGSFSAAARLLNLTQPAVSIQLRELESRLGVRLVERIGKRTVPTPAGVEMIRFARRIHGEAELAVMAMRGHREGKLSRVRIGASELACTYILPDILRRLSRELPDIQILITVGDTSSMVAALLADVVDLALVTMPVRERLLEVEPLRQEPLVAVLPPSARNLPAVMTPELMGAWPLILGESGTRSRRMIDEWLEAGRVRLQVAMTINSVEAIKRVVVAGLGASILPRIATLDAEARGDFQLRPLAPPLARHIALARRRDKPPGPGQLVLEKALATLHHEEPAAAFDTGQRRR